MRESRSVSHARRAKELIPSGGSRMRSFPAPTYIERGAGAYVWDLDGKRFIDISNSFGALILGQAHPRVIEAIRETALSGTAFGAPAANELELAEEVVSRVSSVENIVFCNSGTEADTAALRLARTYTGRDLVAKFEGGFHGWNDHFVYSVKGVGGDRSRPETVTDGAGQPDAIGEQMVVLPYNDPHAFEILEERGDRIAAVFIELVQGAGGAIAAEREWVRQLREVCRRLGIVFVVDEVITGFRIGAGGASDSYGLDPDLIAFGKAIGGGLPVGALGGKREILQEIAVAGRSEKRPFLFGTFSANPLSMAAGLAQLRNLGETEYDHLSGVGERARSGLRALLAELGIAGQVTGIESLWGIHLVDEPLTDVRPILADPAASRLGSRLSTELYREGVLTSTPMHLAFMSTAHTEDDVDEIVEAHRRALTRMLAEGCFES